MCKKSLMSASCAVLGILILAAGCAAPPRWAQEGERTIRDEREKAVFGVGKASPQQIDDVELLEVVARVEARNNAKEAGDAYAADFVRWFVDSNAEWFVGDGLDAFMQEFASRVQTGLDVVIAREWVDSDGRLNGRGTAYALARRNLDREFFTTIRSAAAEVLGEQGDSVLAAELDLVLAGLDAAVAKAVENPFRALSAPAPDPTGDVEVDEDQTETDAAAPDDDAEQSE